MKKILTTLLTLAALAAPLFAQVPKGFNYQMVVRNNTGQLVSDRAVSVKLSIVQGSVTGTEVYQLSTRPTTNTNGLVTLVVGTGDDSARYNAINWGNGPYYIVCEVDPSGGSNYVLRTEQQILAVPYAAYAAVADKVSQSFSYDEGDPKFRAWFMRWAYQYDSLVGAPVRLSQFINDLTMPWDSITGRPTALSQFINDITVDWSNITNKPTFTWDSIQGRPTNLSQFINDITIDWSNITNRPTLVWDSIQGRPTNLSQFTNDITVDWSNITNKPTLVWDSIQGRPTNLSQFTNDITVDWSNVTNKPTTLPWDSITGRPTNLSQFVNDLNFGLHGDTLFLAGDTIMLPSNSGLTVNWDDIVGRPTNVSAFFNDRGYITTEVQTLNDVLTLGNDAGNHQIAGLADPTSPADAANKRYVDQRDNALNAALNGRIDSLQNALNDLGDDIDSLQALLDSTRAAMNGRIDSLLAAHGALIDSLSNAHSNELDSIDSANLAFQHQLIDGELPGIFSVSENTRVRFSRGNLQYCPFKETWRFAPTQYGYSGTVNNNASNQYYNGWIDLFGFGTSGWRSGAPNYGPNSTSTNDIDYTESADGDDLVDMYVNADWGFYNRMINGGNQSGIWRTLSYNEWNYLITDRPRANQLKAMATVVGVQGYILLPDDWKLPAGLVFVSNTTDYNTNVYSATMWAEMEAAGAVFLPSAGYRTASSTAQDGVEGHYWTTTHINGTLSNSIKIATGSGAQSLNANSSTGKSVRVIRVY